MIGKKIIISVAILLFSVCEVYSQIGGRRIFESFSIPNNAKLAALGGVNVSSFDHDINMVASNPALLNSSMSNQLALTYVDYLADIRQNNLSYAFSGSKLGQWGVNVNYVNYGDFIGRDATGNEEGKFSANDYSLNISHSSKIENFTLGGTMKLGVANIAGFKSTAIATDLGGIFRHPENELTIGLALKNIGYQLSTFNNQDRESMPFDAQLGMSYKLEHMPLKFSVTAHRLYQFDIVYLDPNKKGKLDENNNEIKEQKSFADKLARHFVLGGEFLLSKNFNVRAGYNHLRRKELRLESKSGGAGFSVGAMIRIRSFELDYSRAYYHVAGAANYFTVITNLQTLIGKNEL